MNRLLHLGLFLSFFSLSAAAAETALTPAAAVVADTTDPVIFCPGSQILTLGHLKCDTILNYTVNAFDDQGQVIIIMLDGINSGNAFPVGTTITTFLATDLAGNTASCSFSITCNESMTQPQCQDVTIVNLGANCSKNLKAMEVLEGGPYGCPINYIVEVDTTLPFGNGPWRTATFTELDINKEYQVRVTYLQNNARCFGLVEIKDNTPPVLQCADIALPCALPEAHLTPAFLVDSLNIALARPNAGDACTGTDVDLSYVDVFQNLPCNENTIISGIVQRTWSATDANGNTGTCLQTISRMRLLGDVQFPANKTASCQNPDLAPEDNGLPFIQYGGRQYAINDDSYCEFDWLYSDNIVPGNCAGRYTVERTWEVYDACLPLSGNNPKTGVQIIEVVDQNGPKMQCPADLSVTIPEVNCRGSVDLPDLTLSDGCSGLASLQATWIDNGLQTLAGIIEYQTDSTGTDTLGIMGVANDFAIGTTTMTYRSVDDCGNSTSCTFRITVANIDPPIARCDTTLEVTLPPSGYLNLPASAFDDGSTDDCTTPVFKLKLDAANACHSAGAALTDTLQLCCHILGDIVVGTLRVYDITAPAGIVSNDYGAGHYSECTFKVAVTGNSEPTCVAPANITVDCEAFDPSLSDYGGLVSQSCAVDSMNLTVSYSLFDSLCSRGTITRLFRVFDSFGQSSQCTQKIVVDYLQNYYVRFPNDVVVTACDSTGSYGQPTFFGENCENFSVTFVDEIINVVPDACYRIDRTWTVVNLCTYDPLLPKIVVPNPSPQIVQNHPDNLVGPTVSPVQMSGDPWKATVSKISPSDAVPTNFAIYWDQNANGYVYKQTIKIVDTQDPVLENCYGQVGQAVDDVSNNDAQLWNAQYWLDPVHVSSDMPEGVAHIGMTAYDACSKDQVTISFQLLLDLNGDNVRETTINSSNLPPTNTVLFNNSGGPGEARQFDFRPVAAAQKWRFAKEEIVNGNKRSCYIRFNTEAAPNTYVPLQLPYGSHKVKWFVTDACGNESVCEYNVVIRDVKVPTVLCAGNVSVNMTPVQIATAFASDLIQYTEDNVTPPQFLTRAIRKAGTGVGFPLGNNGNPITSVEFDCDQLGPQMVELWSRDRYGNAGVCLTSVNVTDLSSNCTLEEDVEVSGKITTELNQGLAGVEVDVVGTHQFAPPFSYAPADLTDTTGAYFVPNSIPIAANFTITPELDLSPQNGLTTYDLLLISRHILAIEALGSPFKIIAADANRSNTITTTDIVEFRKLILGLYTELPNNTSWRFVPKSHVFSNPQFPFQSAIPDKIVVSEILMDMTNADFWAIKVGDVNNTVEINTATTPDERQAPPQYFDISSNVAETLQTGEVFELNLRSAEILLGCQFTLNLSGLEVLELTPGEHMSREHFAVFPAQEALTVAWEQGGVADFSLKCRAQRSGNLREMVSFDSRITKAEAYPAAKPGVAMPTLRFPAQAAFELYQNQPNPFSEETEIRFNLPEAGEVTLKVHDANGRLVFTQTAYFDRGVQSVKIAKEALDVTGVLYYQVETEKYSASRKMVRL